MLCDVCSKNEALGVCCVPGCPVSMAYCKECLQANAHPWGILVANTACCNGRQNMVEAWNEMILATCKHLGKTIEQFDADVALGIKQMEERDGDEHAMEKGASD